MVGTESIYRDEYDIRPVFRRRLAAGRQQGSSQCNPRDPEYAPGKQPLSGVWPGINANLP
jgi:hypothetical protein